MAAVRAVASAATAEATSAALARVAIHVGPPLAVMASMVLLTGVDIDAIGTGTCGILPVAVPISCVDEISPFVSII